MFNLLEVHKPIHAETKTISNGSQVTFYLVELPLDLTEPCPLNPRLGTDQPASRDDHKQYIVNEAPVQTSNLIESMKQMPVTDVPISSYKNGDPKTQIISGNRRRFCAEDAGLETLFQWVVVDQTNDTIEAIRDYPETHPTKVDHDTWAIDRNIRLALERAATPEKRENVVAQLQTRFGVTKARIVKAEKQQIKMEQFCNEIGETCEDRRRQYKSFGEYTKLHDNELNDLRLRGEFERVEILDKVAKAKLRYGHAHDDMSDTVKILAKVPKNDPLLADVGGRFDLSNEEDLRTLTKEVRLHSVNGTDPIDDIRRMINRAFRVAMERADKSLCQSLSDELTMGAAKFDQLQTSI